MKLAENKFSSFILTPEETLRGSILTLEQKWFLQNCLAEEAAGKLAIQTPATGEDMTDFIKDEAYYRGKIDFIEWLQANSDAAVIELELLNTATNPE